MSSSNLKETFLLKNVSEVWRQFAIPAIFSPQFARKGSNVSAIMLPRLWSVLNAEFRESTTVRAKLEKENKYTPNGHFTTTDNCVNYSTRLRSAPMQKTIWLSVSVFNLDKKKEL